MNKRKLILFLLILCWAGTVFMFSAEPANESDKRSDPIVDILMEVKENCIGNLEQDIKTNDNETLRDIFVNIVRKSAHFTLYLIGGILLYLFIDCYNQKDKAKFFLSLLCCFLYATSDEVHQYFVPGRYASAVDVMIDTLGSLVGILLLKYVIKNKLKKCK